MVTPSAGARIHRTPSTAPLRSGRTAPPAGSRPSPILKWAGGKGRLLAQLEPLLPPGVELMRHVEPFFGGGALFFSRTPERALIADVNPELVNAYRTVRDDVQGLIAQLARLAAQHSKDAYYLVRAEYNGSRQMSPTRRAAMFIYMNKTCFNGLHRVNRRGHFNVPAGSYKNPRILDSEALLAANALLARADIRCEPFESLLEAARPGDFVYFDPPYEPVSRTANFTGYAANGFDADDQRRLRDVFRELDRRGAKLMLSNSDAPLIRELYGDYRIDEVAAPRAINCNARARGPVTELVVRNYR